ncbi:MULTISPECIES: carbohydrate ABC transporter permease [Methylococcus]|uniref:Carbohydrate ABC transporter permease n=1 Tax=Methylococcus capsulatus TaxID=414 RepID=A0ABZ2F4Y0_METCP|nr:MULTISPECIES: carbohydrate ABC transporter permease [Methylococcus]MDF9393754.1 carbohydrate ABC transporter permease [Methylococcus capsulatus]
MRYSKLVIYLVLVLATAATLFPLVWMVSVSLMPPADALRYPPPLWPKAPTLEHYRALFDRLAVARYALNSLVLAAAVTALSVLVNAAAGYAFACLTFMGRDRLFQLLLAAMVIPGQVAMLPLFLLLKLLGLVNTYAGVIVPGLASIFGIFLVRQYALSLPQGLLDAARLDGAGELRIFWSLVLPLCRPVLITLAVFTFLGSWNDFLWPLIILTDSRLHTLPVALAVLMGEHAVDTELMMAGAALTVVPVIVLFLAAQRYYLGGLMQGGIKG